jgi:hypothetical protein
MDDEPTKRAKNWHLRELMQWCRAIETHNPFVYEAKKQAPSWLMVQTHMAEDHQTCE